MLGENRPKLQTGGNFDPIPSGKYTLQIADVNSIVDTYKGVEQDKFKFMFIILNDNKFKGEDGKEQTTRGRKLWNKFSTFISPKSYLHKFIEILDSALLNMGKEEKESYNLDSLVGKQIDALVSKDLAKDKSAYWNNIQSFEKCEEELEGFDDLPGNPVVINKTSVPVTAPDTVLPTAPQTESADDFINGLKKDSDKAKAEKSETAQPVGEVSETPAQKAVREIEEMLAKAKADAGIK